MEWNRHIAKNRVSLTLVYLAHGLCSENANFLFFGLRPRVWVSTWISMTTQTWMNRQRYCWLNPPSGLKLLLLQCQHCVWWCFFSLPSNLPKVRVLILFFFFIRAVPRPHKKDARGTKTCLWWTLNCTLICDGAGKFVFQEPHKQKMQEVSCLPLLFQLCTPILIFFSTSLWCERIWH